MEIEKRIEILKEVESVRKKLAEPSLVHRFSFVTYSLATLSSIVGIYDIAMGIAIIAKKGVTPITTIMLTLGFIFTFFQWFYIANHNYNKKLLLIYEALLANNSKDSNSVT